jgi:signal transduction histidine kinase
VELTTPELEQRWRAWLVQRNARGLRIGLRAAVVLYPTFGLLDLLLAPRDALPRLWIVRGLTVLAILPAFSLIRSRLFERHYELICAIYAIVPATGIAMMTPYMGGLASPYYAGINIVVVAVPLLFVWTPRATMLTQAGLVASFPVVNLLFGTLQGGPIAFSNLSFLSATALVAAAGQVLVSRTQREQFEQRVRLEQATANLEHAHAELQQLDQFKSRFFANMTHELRTPLAVILTPLELLLQGEMGQFTEAQRSSFQTMFKSALKLLKLINDLLDLSRLEESRLRLKVEEHDLVPYLRTLADHTQVLARHKSIVLDFRPELDRARIWCDLERLERVFVNLLSNAIKFTPAGGHVRVSLLDRPEAVDVVVEDDGPGFPPEQAARLFERFYQVDMAGTRQHGGAGIGLALAREIVLLHGGDIVAASDGRSGARFTVTLCKGRDHFRPDAIVAAKPALQVGEPEPGVDLTVQLGSRDEFRLLDIAEAAERRVVERDSDEDTRPYTVLVVEDSPQLVRLVHMSLRRQFKVLTAPDGVKGLELALREKPSLVVTDLMMPGMDGLELTRRLRSEPSVQHTPIIMLTARGELDDRVKGLETGVSAYLTKPFSPKELLTCARELVRAEERTADLVLTQRMESVETVTAGLAHEMNNPLNYARNALARVRLDAAELARIAAAAAEERLGSEDREKLERVAGRLHELLAVADSGLRRIGGTVDLMGRYGRGGFRRERVSCDAWAALRAAVDIVLPATGRKVNVDVDLVGDGTLDCVPEELTQVFTNLVQNAIEAAPDPGGRVWASGTVDGEDLVIRVKDDGPGVPHAHQARLFTPFFTTKGPGHGTGLGLTIARRVIQSLGGTIQLTSQPGEGAEFVVRVPRRAAGSAPSSALDARPTLPHGAS